jgi:hypothetical protein
VWVQSAVNGPEFWNNPQYPFSIKDDHTATVVVSLMQKNLIEGREKNKGLLAVTYKFASENKLKLMNRSGLSKEEEETIADRNFSLKVMLEPGNYAIIPFTKMATSEKLEFCLRLFLGVRFRGKQNLKEKSNATLLQKKIKNLGKIVHLNDCTRAKSQ